MIFYLGDSVNMNETAVDLIELGKVKMSEMDSIPFIAPYYKGEIIPRTSKTMCKEFGGNC